MRTAVVKALHLDFSSELKQDWNRMTLTWCQPAVWDCPSTASRTWAEEFTWVFSRFARYRGYRCQEEPGLMALHIVDQAASSMNTSSCFLSACAAEPAFLTSFTQLSLNLSSLCRASFSHCLLLILFNSLRQEPTTDPTRTGKQLEAINVY